MFVREVTKKKKSNSYINFIFIFYLIIIVHKLFQTDGSSGRQFGTPRYAYQDADFSNFDANRTLQLLEEDPEFGNS